MKIGIQVSEKQDIQNFCPDVFLYFSFLIKFNAAETLYFHANYSKTLFVTSSDPNNNAVYSNKLSCHHGVYNLNFVNLTLSCFDRFM